MSAVLKRISAALVSARSDRHEKREFATMSSACTPTSLPPSARSDRDEEKKSPTMSSASTQTRLPPPSRSDRDEKKKSVKMSSASTPTSLSEPCRACGKHSGPWPPGPEPGPLPRAAKTGGCRLPELAMIAEAYEKTQSRHAVEPSLSMRLAADLERPFGQSTGRGFSFTRFKVDSYSTIVMRQRDMFAPLISPDRTISLQTLQEVAHLVTHADPICGHLRWEDEYPFLVPNLANSSFHRRSSEDETGVAPLMAEETANLHPRLRCALLHKTGCDCRDSIAFGSLGYCPRCFTDFAVDLVAEHASRRPGGRLLVFTTWKYVGDGSARSHYWPLHQTSAKPNRFYGPGHIQRQFEDDREAWINVDKIHLAIASVRESRREAPLVCESREEAPPKYTAAKEPGSWVIEMDK